jgi:hypothetical protein
MGNFRAESERLSGAFALDDAVWDQESVTARRDKGVADQTNGSIEFFKSVDVDPDEFADLTQFGVFIGRENSKKSVEFSQGDLLQELSDEKAHRLCTRAEFLQELLILDAKCAALLRPGDGVPDAFAGTQGEIHDMRNSLGKLVLAAYDMRPNTRMFFEELVETTDTKFGLKLGGVTLGAAELATLVACGTQPSEAAPLPTVDAATAAVSAEATVVTTGQSTAPAVVPASTEIPASPAVVDGIYPAATPSPSVERPFPTTVGDPGPYSKTTIDTQIKDFTDKLEPLSTFKGTLDTLNPRLETLKTAYEKKTGNKLELISRFDAQGEWWTKYYRDTKTGRVLVLTIEGTPTLDAGGIVELTNAKDIAEFELKELDPPAQLGGAPGDPSVPMAGTMDYFMYNKWGFVGFWNVDGNLVARFDPVSQRWVSSSGQPCPFLSEGTVFGNWEDKWIPTKEGNPDFVTSPKLWSKVSNATPGNIDLWIQYFMDLSKGVLPDPTGEVNEIHFGWGEDGGIRFMGLPPADSKDKRQLANELLFGVVFENAITNSITGKKENFYLIPYRMRMANGQYVRIPTLISQWEYTQMEAGNKRSKFSKAANIQFSAPSLDMINSGDVSGLSGANREAVLFMRDLRAAGWLTDSDFEAMRAWIADNFSTGHYSPAALPDDLAFMVGGVVVYTR